jgi:flagellar hook-length control protein FliK
LAFEPIVAPAAAVDLSVPAGALAIQPPAGAPFAVLLETELAAETGPVDVVSEPALEPTAWSEALPPFVPDTWRQETGNDEETPLADAGDAAGPEPAAASVEEASVPPGTPLPLSEPDPRPSAPEERRSSDEADGRIDGASVAPLWLSAAPDTQASGAGRSDTPAARTEADAREVSAAPVLAREEWGAGNTQALEHPPDAVSSVPEPTDDRGSGAHSRPVQPVAEAMAGPASLLAFPESGTRRDLPPALPNDALEDPVPVHASGVARPPQAQPATDRAPHDQPRDVPLPRWSGFMASPADRIDAVRRSVAARAQASTSVEPAPRPASSHEAATTNGTGDLDHALPSVPAGTRLLVPHAAAVAPQSAGISQAEPSGIPNEPGVRSSIVHAIRMQLKDGSGTALIKLDPAFLGTVTVSLHVEAGAVTATLHADDPQVRSWMAAAEPTLRQGLAEQGLTLDRLEVVDERGEARSDADARGRRRQPTPWQYVPPRRAQPGTFEVVV